MGNGGIRFREQIVPERGEFRRGFVLKIPGDEWGVGVVDSVLVEQRDLGDWAPTRDAPTAERGGGGGLDVIKGGMTAVG